MGRNLTNASLIGFWIGLGMGWGTTSLAQLPSLEPLPTQPIRTESVDPAIRRSEDYLLGPGDQIAVMVFGYEEYQGDQVILPDGNITLPIIGQVRATRRTPAQLAAAITQALEPLLVDPVVTVKLVRLRPLVVNVAGEVQRPGPIQLEGLSPTIHDTRNAPAKAPTVSLALAAAGGLTRDANIRGIVLRRHTSDAEPEIITLNLWEAISSDRGPIDLLLRDGDSLYVPKATEASDIDPRLVARSRYAPDTVRVRVIGEVKRPGEIQIPPDSSISGAVAIAGGPTDKADMGQVAFLRLNENGTVDRQTLNLSDLSDNRQIQDGDVVVVPKNDSYSAIDFATDLFNPLGVLIRLFR